MKRSNILLLSALAIVAVVIVAGMIVFRVALMAQIEMGNGTIIEKHRTTEAWNKVKVKGNIHVYFTQADQTTLLVRTDENLHEFIRTEIVNNQLIIEPSRSIRSLSDMKVELSNAVLYEIEASAGSRFFTNNELQLASLKVVGNAGSVMNIQGIFDALDVMQNAGARITLAGKTDLLKIESNAGGSVDAAELDAREARVEANAGASAIVNAQLLDARAVAGGTINYIGNPVFSGMDVTAGGRISQRN